MCSVGQNTVKLSRFFIVEMDRFIICSNGLVTFGFMSNYSLSKLTVHRIFGILKFLCASWFLYRVVVDYLIESLWEDHWWLRITRKSGCPDGHKTDFKLVSVWWVWYVSFFVSNWWILHDRSTDGYPRAPPRDSGELSFQAILGFSWYMLVNEWPCSIFLSNLCLSFERVEDCDIHLNCNCWKGVIFWCSEKSVEVITGRLWVQIWRQLFCANNATD